MLHIMINLDTVINLHAVVIEVFKYSLCGFITCVGIVVCNILADDREGGN